MRKTPFTTLLAATICAGCATMLTGCGGGGTVAGDLPTLDLEAAIDNPRPFDLSEIAASIEFIPLDDSTPEALLSGAGRIAETKNGFYITDGGAQPVKLFDRGGRFVANRGSIGRGPNEYQNVHGLEADYDTDRVWVVSQYSLIAYDADGRMVARNDSVSSLGRGVAWFDGRVILMKDPPLLLNLDEGPGPAPAPDSVTTIVDIFTPDLRREDGIEVRAKGTNFVLNYDTDGNGVGNFRLYVNANIISGNGEDLYFKEGRSDTVFRYVSTGSPVPAFRLDGGKYAVPDEAYLSFNPGVDMDRYYTTGNLLRSPRYTFVLAGRGYGDTAARAFLVFDRDDPEGGFLATGPDGVPGLSLGGVAFEPGHVRDGRLVGYLQALDIVDAAEADAITDPKLKALAATLREDSNPVIVVAELKK